MKKANSLISPPVKVQMGYQRLLNLILKKVVHSLPLKCRISSAE
jgi:hypothetical protein